MVLLTEKAESLPGILLTLPFAFQDLEQFQRFEHEWRIADLAKRRLESRQQRTATSDSSSDVISGKKSPERSSLRDRIASQKSAKLEAAEILKGSQYQYYRSVAYERELTGGIEPAPYDLHFFHPQYLHESVCHSDDGDEDEDDDKDESVDFLQDESDETDPRHFIRRSPFPTVVILRNDLATMAASRNNTAVSLELLGASDFEVLQATMEKCIRMSLGWT